MRTYSVSWLRKLGFLCYWGVVLFVVGLGCRQDTGPTPDPNALRTYPYGEVTALQENSPLVKPEIAATWGISRDKGPCVDSLFNIQVYQWAPEQPNCPIGNFSFTYLKRKVGKVTVFDNSLSGCDTSGIVPVLPKAQLHLLECDYLYGSYGLDLTKPNEVVIDSYDPETAEITGSFNLWYKNFYPQTVSKAAPLSIRLSNGKFRTRIYRAFTDHK